MRTFAQRQNQPKKKASSSLARPNRATLGRAHPQHLILHLQRTIGNQAVLRMLQIHAQEPDAERTATSPRFRHDHSRSTLHAPVTESIQTKLAINKPGDEYEQEADRAADQVMRMPEPRLLYQGPARLQTRHVGTGDQGQTTAPPMVHEVLRSSGSSLDQTTRDFMEPRFGHDFSHVRVHSGEVAGQSAQEVNAHAYTVGHDIVFGAGRFAPGTKEGQRLIAHELMHVVQQSGSDVVNQRAAGKESALKFESTCPVHIQRDDIEMEGIDVHPKGLSMEKHVKHVTGRWMDLWRLKKDSNIRTLLGDMIATLSAESSSLRVAPVVFDPTPATTEAGFRYQEWKIQVNLDIILGRTVSLENKVSSLSADELAIIGETLYHEGRHAEQAFLVAKKRAITIRDPNALARDLDMPVSIARAAVLSGQRGVDDPDDERIEEWAAFHPSGRYFAYWQWNEALKKVTADTLRPIVARSPHTVDDFRSTAEHINRTINILGTKWVFPFEKMAEIERLPAPKPLDTEVLAQLRSITSAFDKLVLAIDNFRSAVSLLQLIQSHPDQEAVRISDAEVKWISVRIAQTELFLAQSAAYLAYPHEVDARRAGDVAKQSVLAATRPARAR